MSDLVNRASALQRRPTGASTTAASTADSPAPFTWTLSADLQKFGSQEVKFSSLPLMPVIMRNSGRVPAAVQPTRLAEWNSCCWNPIPDHKKTNLTQNSNKAFGGHCFGNK